MKVRIRSFSGCSYSARFRLDGREMGGAMWLAVAGMAVFCAPPPIQANRRNLSGEASQIGDVTDLSRYRQRVA
jgi:hypothetical protein